MFSRPETPWVQEPEARASGAENLRTNLAPNSDTTGDPVFWYQVQDVLLADDENKGGNNSII